MAGTKPDPLAADRQMIERLLDLLALNAQHRLAARAYGEVVVRINWDAGRVKTIRFVEETIIRNPDELLAAGNGKGGGALTGASAPE